MHNERALEAEERAHALLQWGSPAPLAPFDEDLAVEGFYTRIQRERSDKALAAFEEAIDKENQPLSELDAFKVLEGLGIITRNHFYSPAKAANEFYTKRLKQHREGLLNEGQGRGQSGVSTGKSESRRRTKKAS